MGRSRGGGGGASDLHALRGSGIDYAFRGEGGETVFTLQKWTKFYRFMITVRSPLGNSQPTPSPTLGQGGRA